MTLTIEEKTELRSRIEQMLAASSFNNKRIHLPKEDLETILFDTNETFGIKRIAFNSKYLYRLDLSEVDFTGVTFDNALFGDKIVNLKNTNAKIDFSKTPEYQKTGRIVISNVNFENVDLGNNYFDELTADSESQSTIKNCNFTRTHLKFTELSKLSFVKCSLKDTDLSHIDLNISCFSNQTPEDMVLESEDNKLRFECCDLSGTGAYLHIKMPIMKYQYSNLIQNPFIENCYFEDVLVGPDINGNKPEISSLVNPSTKVLEKDEAVRILELINKQINKD